MIDGWNIVRRSFFLDYVFGDVLKVFWIFMDWVLFFCWFIIEIVIYVYDIKFVIVKKEKKFIGILMFNIILVCKGEIVGGIELIFFIKRERYSYGSGYIFFDWCWKLFKKLDDKFCLWV